MLNQQRKTCETYFFVPFSLFLLFFLIDLFSQKLDKWNYFFRSHGGSYYQAHTVFIIIKQHYWYLIFLIKFNYLMGTDIFLIVFDFSIFLHLHICVLLHGYFPQCRISCQSMIATDSRVVMVILSDTAQDQESIYQESMYQ